MQEKLSFKQSVRDDIIIYLIIFFFFFSYHRIIFQEAKKKWMWKEHDLKLFCDCCIEKESIDRSIYLYELCKLKKNEGEQT